MLIVSKVSYGLVGLVVTALWTSAIIALTTLPLPTQLALGAMSLVAFLWGYSVLFPKERAVGAASAPGRMPRDEVMLSAIAPRPLPTGSLRMPVTRPPRNTSSLPPPGDLPPLLRTPFEEAARMEAHRLAEALTSSGLFGSVNVRLTADGMALVAPVSSQEAVGMPIEKLVRFAAYATQPEGLVATGRHGDGSWSGAALLAAIDAHLGTIPPHQAAVPAASPARTASQRFGAARLGEDLTSLTARPRTAISH